MNRRKFFQTFVAAGAGLGSARANAQTTKTVAPYLERLQARLADAGGGIFATHVEEQLLALHNMFRFDQGTTMLRRHPDLDCAARAHVADLLARSYFAHVSPEGFRAEQRVGLLARRFLGASGENIAMESGGGSKPTAAEFVRLWRNSPGHRSNMVRPTFTHVGFGVVMARGSTIAGAVFGQTYGELRTPAPLWVGAGEGLSGVLAGASAELTGYQLQPVGGGELIGPFASDEAPTGLGPGAYTIRPHAPDRAVPRRYWLLYGPIVLTG